MMRRLIVVLTTLVLATLHVNAQITIREKIRIGQPGVTVSSVGGDSLHLCYTYWACGGWQGTIRVTTPCSTSYEVVGPPSDQYQGQSVCLDIPLFEPGTYEITTPGTPNCPPGQCGYSSNCREYLHFWDDNGNHYYPPGPDPTGAYLYTNAVECTQQELQPQKLSYSSFEVYRNQQQYAGVDISGIPCTGIVILCDTIDQHDTLTFGLTKTFNQTPSPGDSCLVHPSYSQFRVCRDGSSWRLRLEGLKLPFISDFCIPPLPPPKPPFVDLEDGSDTSLLSQHIYSCDRYNAVMKTLDYLMDVAGGGRYHYMFSGAVLAHENQHLAQLYNWYKPQYDEYFKNVQDSLPPVQQGECMPEMIGRVKPLVDQQIIEIYEGINPRAAQYEQNVLADKFMYPVIRDRIKAWARQAHPDWFGPIPCTTYF